MPPDVSNDFESPPCALGKWGHTSFAVPSAAHSSLPDTSSRRFSDGGPIGRVTVVGPSSGTSGGGGPIGLAYARKRLVAVFRACGSDPQNGDEICPAVLSNACLEVKVAHESWKNTVRLQVVGYRVHSDLPVKVGDPDAGTPPCAGVQGGGGSHG